MARPANQASGTGDTNRKVGGSRVRAPKKSQLDRVLGWDPSHLAAVLSTTGLSVPDFQKLGRFQQGQTFRQAYDAYKNQNDPGYFAQPQTLAQANLAADAATRLKYGGAESALNQQITQTPQWYQQYKDTVAGAQQAAQRYQQGLVDQSQNVATQIGQAVLSGIDPNSQAAQNDQLAAKSRQALANLGTDLIRAGGAANDQYFGSRAGVADASQMGTMAKLLQQRQQLAGEKADFRTSTLNDLRQTAANQYLAQQTLGANVANQQADNAQAAANATQAAADRKASRVVSRKNTRDRIAAQQDKQTVADTAKQAAADAKHQAKIQGAIGKAKNKIQDIIDYRQGDIGQLTDDLSKPKDSKGNQPSRKVTQQDIDKEKVHKYGTLGSIAIAIRDGRPLTPAQVNYLHNADPNFRIPREWLAGKRRTVSRPGNAPAQGGNRPT